MNILAKTLAAIAAGALLATSVLVVDPEGGVLTAQTVTFESPGK